MLYNFIKGGFANFFLRLSRGGREFFPRFRGVGRQLFIREKSKSSRPPLRINNERSLSMVYTNPPVTLPKPNLYRIYHEQLGPKMIVSGRNSNRMWICRHEWSHQQPEHRPIVHPRHGVITKRLIFHLLFIQYTEFHDILTSMSVVYYCSHSEF